MNNTKTTNSFPIPQKAIKAALFDLDGTLFHSMDVWLQVDSLWFAQRQIPMPSDFTDKISHMNFSTIAEYTIKRFGLPDTPEKLKTEWLDMVKKEYSEKIVLKPNAKNYLHTLHESGIKLAVVTSLPRTVFTPLLKKHGIYDLFLECLSAEELHLNKDEPTIYIEAANRLGVLPQECIGFEDILPAIKSLKKAGVHPIGVADNSSAHVEKEIQQHACLFIRDFKEAPFFHGLLKMIAPLQNDSREH